MTWSPDGKTIVLGNKSDDITHVDVDNVAITKTWRSKEEVSPSRPGRQCRTLEPALTLLPQANEVAFSHNGSLLFSALNGYVHIDAFPSGEQVHKVHVATASTTVIDLDPRGR